ncbi:MAG: hypothetical protein Q8N77_02500 [Nanoarchaeota archaeon]|nr:hypothetical protein [Nanoarchaeota archaeon]
MTFIIGYQGNDFAVIGTDLCSRNLFGRYSLKDKLKKSKTESHYIAWSGIMNTFEEEELYSKPLEKLILEASDLQMKVPTKMRANAIIVAPEHNQIYYWGNNPNTRVKLKQDSLITLGIDLTLFGIPCEKLKNRLNPKEIADKLMQVVLLVGEYFPQYVNGVAVYTIEHGSIREHYHSIKAAAYLI